MANPTASPVEESVRERVSVPPLWAKAKEKADTMPATKVMNFFKFIRNTQLTDQPNTYFDRKSLSWFNQNGKYSPKSVPAQHYFTRSGLSLMNFSQPPAPFTLANGLVIE